jgi:hypothetical protein
VDATISNEDSASVNLRLLCWIWILVATTITVFNAPVAVTRKVYSQEPQITKIEWIGPFAEPYDAHRITKSSLDLSRLALALLLANLLPAVVVWQHDRITQWWQRRHPPLSKEEVARIQARRKKEVVLFVKTAIIFVFVIGVVTLIADNILGRVKSSSTPTTSSGNFVDKPTTPTPAPASRYNPSEWKIVEEPTPAPRYSDIPPGFTLVEEPTPTPIRRAIPIH